MNNKISQFFLNLVGDYYKPYPGLIRPSRRLSGMDMYFESDYMARYREELGRRTELDRMDI